MRLDIFLVKSKLTPSRNTALALIKTNLVKVNNEIVNKPAKEISENNGLWPKIEILEMIKYVGRGGLKLEKALNEFKIDPTNQIVLDVGSSTGGFTDCLLQAGAKKVFAVDVGTGQLAEKLKNNPQVISLEQTDIRQVASLPEKPSLAVIDVSFISLEKILEKVSALLTIDGKIIALIKPQFETQKTDKNRSGIVTDSSIRDLVLEKIKNFAVKIHLKVSALTDSPILGGSGNKEYLILLEK